MTAEAVHLVPPPQGRTVADLEALPDNGLRYELVDGVITVMAAAQWGHNVAQRRLTNLIERQAPPGFAVGENSGVVLGDDQCPIPDVVILATEDPGRTTKNFPIELVALVAEIVSPSTRANDRFRKPGQFAEAGIPVYLRVELDPPHVVAHEIGDDGRYVEVARAEPGQELRLARPFPIAFDPAVLLQ